MPHQPLYTSARLVGQPIRGFVLALTGEVPNLISESVQ